MVVSLPLVNRKFSGAPSYQRTQIFTLFMHGGATYHKYSHKTSFNSKMFTMSFKMDTLPHNVVIKFDMTVELSSGFGEDDI